MTQGSIRLSGLQDVWWRPSGLHRDLADAVQACGIDAAGPVLRYVDLEARTGVPSGVALLLDAKVIGDARLVALGDDWLVGNVQFLFGLPDDQAWVLRQRRLRVPRRIGGEAALIAASDGDNYYHWLFDALPRLGLLEFAGCDLAALPRVVLNRRVHPFQAQSLRRLGIADSRWSCSGKRDVVLYERLWLPTMPGPLGRPPRWVCTFLRERFAAAVPPGPRRRLYVSRRHAAGRRIVNEDEILPALRRHGFEAIHAERLSFDEQVALFASASHVIAVHGAGMSNTVFCPPGTRVLELRSPSHFNECFSAVAAGSDLAYHSTVLQPAGGTPSQARYGDLHADVAAFEAELERLG